MNTRTPNTPISFDRTPQIIRCTVARIALLPLALMSLFSATSVSAMPLDHAEQFDHSRGLAASTQYLTRVTQRGYEEAVDEFDRIRAEGNVVGSIIELESRVDELTFAAARDSVYRDVSIEQNASEIKKNTSETKGNSDALNKHAAMIDDNQSAIYRASKAVVGLRDEIAEKGKDALAVSAAKNAAAYGVGAQATADGSTALGRNAVATADNAVALGAGSVADEPNTISAGNPDQRRRITNVADGINPNDAVNLRQANAALQGSRNAAVKESKHYTDQKVGEIRSQVKDLDKSMRKGIASVAALQMTTPYAPGRVAINAGTAMYRGQAAIAVGISYWNTAGNLNVNGGMSTAGGDSTIVRAGVGYLF